MTSVYPEQLLFGSGTFAATRTDVANSTPVSFATLQDISMDFSGDLKPLYGRNQYAIALARGKTKIEGKVKFTEVNSNLYNSLYFGATLTTGAGQSIKMAYGEPGTIPSSVAYTITVMNASSFVADYGVSYASTGLALTLVASAPTVGQYMVNPSTGVYTFAAADEGLGVNISYSYTTTTGKLITIANPLMGAAPSFQAILNGTFDGRQATYIYNNCKSSKLTVPTKQDDWGIQELDFMVSADRYGNIGSISTDI